jgi:peptidoglycan hydrolase-like protein with peptidoglycan-binding domain
VRYDAAKTPTSDDDDESLAEDKPALPRPANRFVSDIAPGRVTEIQNALMKAGVFAGPATGVYDQTTFDAMTTFQARRGFGATGMPTAEALKALGVRKNSGIGLTTPAVVVQSTAPSAATSTSIPTPPPNR